MFGAVVILKGYGVIYRIVRVLFLYYVKHIALVFKVLISLVARKALVKKVYFSRALLLLAFNAYCMPKQVFSFTYLKIIH